MQFKNFFTLITTFSLLNSFGGLNASAKIIPKPSNKIARNILIAQNKKVSATIATGIGATLEEASKNAAENALTNIVGSFIDRETLLQKRTEIRDGILEKTKTLTVESRDYSQGTIKSFEVIDFINKNNIFKVTARVSVYIDDFRAYIKELASDSQIMDTGLFAQISADAKNDKNSLKIFESIVLPLLTGEVAKIKTGTPMRLSEYLKKIRASESYQSKRARDFFRYASYNQRTSIALPMTISIKENFLENMNIKLANISTKMQEVNSSRFPEYALKNQSERDDLKIGVANIETNTKKIYTIKNLEKIIDETYNVATHPLNIRTNSSGSLNNKKINPFYSFIVVELLDDDGVVIAQQGFWGTNKGDNNEEIGILCVDEVYGRYMSSCLGRPVSLYRQGTGAVRYIASQKQFIIILNLTPDKLSKVKKVNVKYQPHN